MRVIVRSDKGSRPGTVKQARQIANKLPSGVEIAYQPSGVARAFDHSPDAIRREFDRRVRGGSMKKLTLMIPEKGACPDLAKVDKIPLKDNGAVYVKLREEAATDGSVLA